MRKAQLKRVPAPRALAAAPSHYHHRLSACIRGSNAGRNLVLKKQVSCPRLSVDIKDDCIGTWGLVERELRAPSSMLCNVTSQDAEVGVLARMLASLVHSYRAWAGRWSTAVRAVWASWPEDRRGQYMMVLKDRCYAYPRVRLVVEIVFALIATRLEMRGVFCAFIPLLQVE